MMAIPTRVPVILIALFAALSSTADVRAEDLDVLPGHSRFRFPPGQLENTNTPGGSDLDAWIAQTIQDGCVSAASACVIHDGRVVWVGSQGIANREAQAVAQDTSLYMLASVSKTITGMALLQLWESGAFELDDDVSDYLPFSVVHPTYPDIPITFRMLLAHAASIADNAEVMSSTYVCGDTPIPLSQYVRDYFLPGGVYYDPVRNFLAREPGTLYRYSNHGIVLAGHLVETITGISFPRYCRDSIFLPLGMNETSWFLAGLDTGNVAISYDCQLGSFVPYCLYGYPDYPAGTLRTSVRQLALFLLAVSKHGRHEGNRIIDSTTVDSMFTIQFPALSATQGLVWYRQDVAGYTAWIHTGRDVGVSTIMGYCPESDLGVIVLTNGDRSSITNSIYYRLFTWAGEDADLDGIVNMDDLCPFAYSGSSDSDNDGIGDGCDNCPQVPNLWQDDSDENGIGDACEPCCVGRVGDADGQGGDEPDLNDIMVMVDLLFISQNPRLVACLAEADVDQSSARIFPAVSDITLLDIVLLIDYLYIGTVTDLRTCR